MFGKRRTRPLIALALAGTTWASGASATQTCQGSYTAALLQPLPAHVVAGLDVRDHSPRNLTLADRFLAGLRDAGVSVGAQPNVLLHITTSRLGDTSTQPNRAAAQASEFPGLQGGPQIGLPALPATGFIAPRTPPAPPLLFMQVNATVAGSTRVAWLASLQCQMIGSDEGQLSEDLGRVIGSTLGQRSERRPF
jgi:hypothetical protein